MFSKSLQLRADFFRLLRACGKVSRSRCFGCRRNSGRKLFQQRFDVCQQLILIGQGTANVMQRRLRRGDGRCILQRMRPAPDLRFFINGSVRLRPGFPASPGACQRPGDRHNPRCPAASRTPVFAVLTICHKRSLLSGGVNRRGIFYGWRCRPGYAAGPCLHPAPL